MNVDKFKYITLFDSDINNREINIYQLQKVTITGHNCYYPNVLLHCQENVYNPIDEIIMSLQNVDQKQFVHENLSVNKVVSDPVFYFVYNVDNYYHFIYDTLPYLISYFKLRKTIPSLKLLTNYSAANQNKFYKFVTEFLELLGIQSTDIIIVNKDTLYETIYVSSSYTHGINSNLPPRKEIYDFFQYIVSLAPVKLDMPKKIYISRRTWINNDFSNIGTNYTTRRKLVNEDELVEKLINLGYTEVFTESMNTIEKIQLFSNAEEVIGSIGGGLVNVLFSSNNCKLIALISPTFLDINKRFIYSFKNVNTVLYTNCVHESKDDFKCYMRVQYNHIVGEIINIKNNNITIMYSDNPVSGWNESIKYKTITVNKLKCKKLDLGLNSSWIINLKGLIDLL